MMMVVWVFMMQLASWDSFPTTITTSKNSRYEDIIFSGHLSLSLITTTLLFR